MSSDQEQEKPQSRQEITAALSARLESFVDPASKARKNLEFAAFGLTSADGAWLHILDAYDDLTSIVRIDGIKHESINNDTVIQAGRLVGCGSGLVGDQFWQNYQRASANKRRDPNSFKEAEWNRRVFTNLVVNRLSALTEATQRFKNVLKERKDSPMTASNYMKSFLFMLGYIPIRDEEGLNMLLSFPREDLRSANITTYLVARRNVVRLVEGYRFEDMDLLGRLASTDIEIARSKTDQLIELLLGGIGSRSQSVHEFIEKIGDAGGAGGGFYTNGVIKRLPYPDIDAIYQFVRPQEEVIWTRVDEAYSESRNNPRYFKEHYTDIKRIVRGAYEALGKTLGGNEAVVRRLFRDVMPMMFWFSKQEHLMHLPDMRDGENEGRVSIKADTMRMLQNLSRQQVLEIQQFTNTFPGRPDLVQFWIWRPEGHLYPVDMVGRSDWFTKNSFPGEMISEENYITESAFAHYRARERGNFDPIILESEKDLIIRSTQEKLVRVFDSLAGIAVLPMQPEEKRSVLKQISADFGIGVLHDEHLSSEEKRQVLMAAYVWGADVAKQMERDGLTKNKNELYLLRNALQDPLENYWEELGLLVEPETRPQYLVDRLRVTIGEEAKNIQRILAPWGIQSSDREVIHMLQTITKIRDIIRAKQPNVFAQLSQM